MTIVSAPHRRATLSYPSVDAPISISFERSCSHISSVWKIVHLLIREEQQKKTLFEFRIQCMNYIRQNFVILFTNPQSIFMMFINSENTIEIRLAILPVRCSLKIVRTRRKEKRNVDCIVVTLKDIPALRTSMNWKLIQVHPSLNRTSRVVTCFTCPDFLPPLSHHNSSKNFSYQLLPSHCL